MSQPQPFTRKILLSALACIALVLCALVLATPTRANAQQGGLLDVLQRQRLAIVGTWDLTDPDGVPGVITFNSDGTLIESDVDHTFTTALGTWMHLGGTQFAYTFKQYKKDDQEQVGAVVVYGTVILDASTNSFSGPLHFEFKDTTGKVDTDAGLDLKLVGQRLQVRQ